MPVNKFDKQDDLIIVLSVVIVDSVLLGCVSILFPYFSNQYIVNTDSGTSNGLDPLNIGTLMTHFPDTIMRTYIIRS